MPPTMATGEELELIKSYVLLPMILSAYERDKQIIEESVRNPEIYTDMISAAMDRVTKMLTEIRREFRTRGIKVYEITRDMEGIRADFVCRGYTSNMRMLWSLVRAQASERMRVYMRLNVDMTTSAGDLPEHLRTESLH